MTVSLEESYRACRDLHRRYGTSYYAATWLLPAERRRHVHALYAFCRYADDIVDGDHPDAAAGLKDLGERFFAALAVGDSDHPVLKAVVATARRFELDPRCFERFLGAMAMDLEPRRYGTFDELLEYMDGSAAVIGELLLPILEPSDPAAIGPARDLGVGFQLTNFLRDVGEDLDRGRVYLPAEDLERFAAAGDLAARRVTPRWRALMAFQVARARRFYASGAAGIPLLPPASARCVAGAHLLYGRILDRIEAGGYDVFSRRATVPAWQKAAVAARLLGGRRPGGFA